MTKTYTTFRVGQVVSVIRSERKPWKMLDFNKSRLHSYIIRLSRDQDVPKQRFEENK